MKEKLAQILQYRQQKETGYGVLRFLLFSLNEYYANVVPGGLDLFIVSNICNTT